MFNVRKARYITMYFLKDIMSEKITVIDRQNRETQSNLQVDCERRCIFGCPLNQNFWSPDEILAALATVPVTISSRLTLYLTKIHGWTIARGVGEVFEHRVQSQCEIARTYSNLVGKFQMTHCYSQPWSRRRTKKKSRSFHLSPW